VTNILAIDYGEKRMGFAIGNTLTETAVPLSILKRKNLKSDISHIKKLIEEYDIDLLLIGRPTHMDNRSSEMSKRVDRFTGFLKTHLKIRIDTIDERLSSFEAEEMLKPLKHEYKKRKDYIDSLAACLFLRSYMEKK
jgi:putative Holliday junction resolvase